MVVFNWCNWTLKVVLNWFMSFFKKKPFFLFLFPLTADLWILLSQRKKRKTRMKQHVLGYFLRKQWILLHVGLSSCQPLQADQQTGAQLWSTLIFAERKKKKTKCILSTLPHAHCDASDIPCQSSCAINIQWDLILDTESVYTMGHEKQKHFTSGYFTVIWM